MRLLGKTIVVVGKSFQPSTVSETWLIKRGIARDNQIQGNRICTDALSSFTTNVVDLQILPERMIIRAKDTAQDTDVLRSAQLLLKDIPATSFIAAGINLEWDVTPEGADVVECMSRHLTFAKALPAALKGAALGFTAISNSIFGSRLRVTVTPIPQDPSKPLHFTKINADFNFHFDINPDNDQNDPREQVKQFLDKFHDLIQHANTIAAQLL